VAQHRQRYNEEFKKETVKFIQQSRTKSLPQLAEELNIPVSTLQKWLAKYRTFEDEPVVSQEDLRAAERKIRDLQEEVEILKKAVHFFSKDPS